MSDDSGSRSEKRPAPITKLQWDMPVSLDEKNEGVSLCEYVEGKRRAIPFANLSDEQRAQLAAKRIDMLPGYEMASIGAGVISKERAIREVLAGTDLGQQLAEIEIHVISQLLDEANKVEDSKNG